MENLDIRHMAEDDPRGFLDDHGRYLILDEIQRVPSLFNYLQERVDADDTEASYIVTGSQQFLLMEKITQSLAGRIINFNLYPFTVGELYRLTPDTDTESIFSIKSDHLPKTNSLDMYRMLFTGMYPRIHDKQLSPGKWLENYIDTYVERDIRNLVNVVNLKLFENFLKICAAMSGSVVNYAAISNAVGISQPTAKQWLSLLETSGILFILPPYYNNFKKRIIKSPKLYFSDTGLLCFLLSIRNPDELKHHPLFGGIFETFIVSEFYKRLYHVGERPALYFWRDQTGNEIDLIAERSGVPLPIEIKSAKTHNAKMTAAIHKWPGLSANVSHAGLVLYRGEAVVGKNAPVPVAPWGCV
jgi:predicted AAA+ superfamily ATPase